MSNTGPHEEESPTSEPAAQPPVPLVLSCAMGVLGAAVLVAGAVFDNAALSLVGVLAGTVSLGAALYWRSLLITAWEERRSGRSRR